VAKPDDDLRPFGIKRCPKCGREYDEAAWLRLPHPPSGAIQSFPGLKLELRNCTCGSTLGVVIEGSLEDP
jgi:hypothetical protein